MVVGPFEKLLVLVPSCSVFSVYSVVLVGKITTEYTENTEKTLNKKTKIGGVVVASTRVNSKWTTT